MYYLRVGTCSCHILILHLIYPFTLDVKGFFLRRLDTNRKFVFIIRLLGVETDASRAVNEVPTPTGVACQSQADVFFHRGFINGFFVFETGTVQWVSATGR
jgi:hypothetical protein